MFSFIFRGCSVVMYDRKGFGCLPVFTDLWKVGPGSLAS